MVKVKRFSNILKGAKFFVVDNNSLLSGLEFYNICIEVIDLIFELLVGFFASNIAANLLLILENLQLSRYLGLLFALCLKFF